LQNKSGTEILSDRKIIWLNKKVKMFMVLMYLYAGLERGDKMLKIDIKCLNVKNAIRWTEKKNDAGIQRW